MTVFSLGSVVISAVEVFVDYVGVYVFHVCFYLCAVCGVGICVDIFEVVEYCLFLESECCLSCSVVGVWGVVVLSYYVMRVVD